MTNALKQVGIWLRVSTEDQVKGESLEVHEHRARAYAESKGWTVVEVYRLEAVSGKSVIGHPLARRMIADLEEGRISGLIFSKLARLSRNTSELLQFADIFQKAGADLVSLAESIDTSTPAGRMFYSMLAAMANWEREEITARVAASIPIRAKLGRPLGGRAPYGYRWQDKALVINPDEAPIRAQMYSLYLMHRRFERVASVLNEAGHRSRNGKPWSGTVIERILRDPTSKGEKRSNHTKIEADGSWVNKPESEWVCIKVEPVVSVELWESVNALLTEKKMVGEREARSATTLFGGLCYCMCGSKMYVFSKTVKYCCMAKGCGHKVPVDVIEACFRDELSRLAFSSNDIQSAKAMAQERLHQIVSLIEIQERSIKAVDHKIDSILGLYDAGSIDKRGFEKRYGALGQQLEELEAEVERMKIKETKQRAHLARDVDITTETEGIANRFATMTKADQRHIVETILERVIVGDGMMEFVYHFNPG
jgi:site-specific DNA recombinase